MPSTVWSDLYGRRSEWAIDAYREFVATMHPSLREDVRRQEHVTLVVYGPTQVGKTTLILTTLGIQAPAMARVEGVLRGGQRSGKSATVLATRYGKSRDDSWWLGERGPFAPDAMLDELRVIRERMEAGDDVGSDVVDIRIPRVFFDEKTTLDVSIIDLPGTQAANEAEERHVLRLAERYVPVADVVILVTRVEHLGPLHPKALKLECLQDWAAQPAKFRVVLTHTFSAASVREWPGEDIRDGDTVVGFEFTAEALRKKLYGQLSTHEMPLPQAGERCIFPVEFGKSWHDLGQQCPDYFAKASLISSHFMRELLEGLAAASNPYRRLAAAFDLNALVESKKARLDAEHDLKITELKERAAEAEGVLSTATCNLTIAIAKKNQAESLHAYLSAQDTLAALTEQAEEELNVDVRSPHAKTKTSLRHAAEAHEDELLSRWTRLNFDDPTLTDANVDGLHGAKWLKVLMQARPSSPPRVEEAYNDFKRTVAGRFGGDTYHTWTGLSSYDADCASLRASGLAAKAIVVESTVTWIKKGLDSAVHAAVREAADATKRVDATARLVPIGLPIQG